ncbi:MAG: trimethylamine methyltransferase family protein [Vicinamibacteria bacterium]
MRPTLRLLSDGLADRILDEARDVLARLGVEIHNEGVLALLADHGAEVERATRRARIPAKLVERSLASAPRAIRLHDALGAQTHDLSGSKVHFTPGSAAILILDPDAGRMRPPVTADCVRYAKLVAGLPNIAAQSTALVPVDVHERIQDSYRLFLSLLYGEKPVVTGAFTIESFEVMRGMLVAARGGAAALREKPLAVFSCCPTSPLKWSDVTSQNLVDCARAGIPAELVSMPLSGFMAPVTLVGSLVQHAAETLSGFVIAQLAAPGAPVIWGGSPAVFDVRFETTPMGAVETMMIDCAYNEVAKRLGLPTQAYIGLSDAKRLDAQAGLESGIGAVLAALSGINSISGPGMLDFESCQSLEKLVVDDAICGMALRLTRGIEPRDDFPAVPLLQELLSDGHLLISDHTRRHLREEIAFPGPVIDRANRSRWRENGARGIEERAGDEVRRRIEAWRPTRVGDDTKAELARLMEAEARRAGMPGLPARDA